jgi:hypothetical protein
MWGGGGGELSLFTVGRCTGKARQEERQSMVIMDAVYTSKEARQALSLASEAQRKAGKKNRWHGPVEPHHEEKRKKLMTTSVQAILVLPVRP